MGTGNTHSVATCCYMKNLLIKPIQLADAASIKNGDHAAFLNVYNCLHIKTFRFFYKKVQEGELAKELTQQTFIRLWQFRHTLSETHPLAKQVFIIAHSLLVNHFEKETSFKKFKQQHLAKESLYSHSADQQASFELSEQLNAAIDTLPLVRKKILILKAFHDYSNKEIAQQMDISVKTVEDHVTRAFRRMKQLMMLMVVYMLLAGNSQG